MIFIDESVDEFLKKYEALGEALPLCSCGKDALRPYRTPKTAGIECGLCKTSVRVYIKDDDIFLNTLMMLERG